MPKASPELAERFGYEISDGVLVSKVDPGSRADRAGIRQGSLILEVNQKPVSTVAEAKELLGKNGNEAHLLLVQWGKSTQYVVLKPKQ